MIAGLICNCGSYGDVVVIAGWAVVLIFLVAWAAVSWRRRS